MFLRNFKCHMSHETKSSLNPLQSQESQPVRSDVLAFLFYPSQIFKVCQGLQKLSLMFVNFCFTFPNVQMSHVTSLQKPSLMVQQLNFTFPNFQVSHVSHVREFLFYLPKFSSVTCHKLSPAEFNLPRF